MLCELVPIPSVKIPRQSSVAVDNFPGFSAHRARVHIHTRHLRLITCFCTLSVWYWGVLQGSPKITSLHSGLGRRTPPS